MYQVEGAREPDNSGVRVGADDVDISRGPWLERTPRRPQTESHCCRMKSPDWTTTRRCWTNINW